MAVASLILNFRYAAPTRHWQQGANGRLSRVESRRPAGYEIFDVRNNTWRTENLGRVNEIRGRVEAWRAAGGAGCLEGANAKGGFGLWAWDVAFGAAEMQDILVRQTLNIEARQF